MVSYLSQIAKKSTFCGFIFVDQLIILLLSLIRKLSRLIIHFQSTELSPIHKFSRISCINVGINHNQECKFQWNCAKVAVTDIFVIFRVRLMHRLKQLLSNNLDVVFVKLCGKTYIFRETDEMLLQTQSFLENNLRRFIPLGGQWQLSVL